MPFVVRLEARPTLLFSFIALCFAFYHEFGTEFWPYYSKLERQPGQHASRELQAHSLLSRDEHLASTLLDTSGLTSNLTRRDDYSCDAAHPCSNGACCGGSGYCGYGPTYCGDGCVSNCEALAECGQYSSPPNKKCPLNVCCSQYGFCGTTTDFCGDECQSNCVEHPTPSGAKSGQSVRKRVIGYYEAWSARRSCHPMDPSGLPIDGMTHVNFAFASITPGTYEVTTMDTATPASLFQTTADVKTFKSGNADLEVWVSIGGWTFSDNGTDTQPLFGEISADAGKRQTFANNVVKFMDQYGFDGLDIDWEYPGAPDRGGKKEDTANCVQLVKTLRQTFNASPRKLGLTFTIPTSYWYLRWFDLPNMVEYIDWINMMSYDLHGFWDRENPIGSIVQGHTNLTEIKLAAKLLWRVDVPPEKVVMGVGFYGRSFQLADPSCQTPGCPFGGAANPGACTATGGILGYFEIMDILNGVQTPAAASDSTKKVKRADITPVHDEKDAVNYFTFDHNQWVSCDDKVTFGQKVDWANDLGLSGLMIWVSDLDDKQFTALSGLIGQQVLGGIDDPNDGKSVQQDWSGQNGQQCRKNDECSAIDILTVPKCNPGETMVGWDEGGCGKENGNQYGKAICCPVTAYPRSCQWRGGTGGAADCNGQCHSGEVTLFGSSWGGSPHEDGTDTKKCNRGHKVFCCVSDHWNDLIKGCSFGKCGGGCNDGYTAVTWKHDPQICAYPVGGSGPQNRDFCCPEPKKFNNCHWVGQGDCADNTCDDNDVQILTDSYGDSSHSCNWGRNKAYVPLDELFPTLPPSEDYVKFDLQFPKGQPSGGDPAHASFGWVVIDGPKSVVTSAKVKRDGSPSDLRFLNCQDVVGTERQRVRFVCESQTSNSDCDDMMENGVSGTIIEMPDGCGAATYAVAHEVQLAQDQALPSHLSHAANKTVLDLTFDYDFSLVKRDAGDVYFRVDYSNVGNYWTEAVDAKPVTKRGPDRRFWSIKVSAWASVFSDWLKAAVGVGTTITQNLRKTIYSESIDCDGKRAYADIETSGSVSATARMAISLVGTISPTLNVEEVNAIMDAQIDANFQVDASLYGNLNLPYTIEELFPPITADEFNHIGIVSIAPQLEVDVGLQANTEVSGNFSTGVHAFTSDNIVQGWPGAVHGATGQTAQQTVQNTFAGSIESIGQSGRFKVDLIPRMGMLITPNKYGTDGKELTAYVEAAFDTYNSLDTDSSGSYKVSMGTTAASGELNYIRSANEFTQWAGDNEQSRNIGDAPSGKVLHSGQAGGGGGGGDDPDDGPSPHDITFDASAPFADARGALLTCPSKLRCGDEDFTCKWDICAHNPGYCDDEDAEPGASSSSDEKRRSLLDKRAASRDYNIQFSDGSTITITSRPYPSIGELFEGSSGAQVIDGLFDYINEGDCSIPYVIDRPTDGEDLSDFVTEHIVELQTMPEFVRAAESGNLLSGGRMQASTIPASFFHVNWNTQSLPRNLPPVISLDNYSSNIPNLRVFEAMGSNRNRQHFVACRAEINSVKARVWAGDDPYSTDNFEALVEDWIVNCADPSAFLKLLKATRAVFGYITDDSDVNTRLHDSLASIRTQLQLVENTQGGAGLVIAWDEFIQDYLSTISTRAQAWMLARIADTRSAIARANPPPGNAPAVLAVLSALASEAAGIKNPGVS